MLIPITVTVRDILRNYKKVFGDVKNTKRPVVVVSKKEPQVGIVSLEDMERLKELDQHIRYQQSTKTLLDLAGIIPKGSGLPSDLSKKHNEYTWD